MEELSFRDSIVIARSPEDLYEMVSDVTRMGEWSPISSRMASPSSTSGTAMGAARLR